MPYQEEVRYLMMIEKDASDLRYRPDSDNRRPANVMDRQDPTGQGNDHRQKNQLVTAPAIRSRYHRRQQEWIR